MAKRALVIGSQIMGLRGVDHDVRRMRALLLARGFTVDARTGADASRAGILDGHAALTAATGPGDAAVVYYSGHGGRVVDSDPRAGSREHPGLPRLLQFIVPADYEDGGDDDFRGISGWELSLLLADLTERTRNATVVLDCCYAAQMTRDGAIREAVPRALPHPKRLGIARYLEALRAGGARLERLTPEGSPHAVRLFACADSQSAWEHPGDDGHPGGALTAALVGVLDQVGDAPVSWAVLGRAIRERVLRAFPCQRPELGGPVGRAPFALHEPARSDAVPVATAAGRIVLRAGRIAGVTTGDVFGVMPLDATRYDATRRLATATVIAAGPLEAEVALGHVTAPGGGLPAGALAFPLQRALPPLAVRVEGAGARLAEVRAAIAEAPRLVMAAPGDRDASLAVVRVADGSLRIADQAGDLVGPLPLAGSGARETIADVVGFLADLAVARAVRELEGAHGLAADAIAVGWGTVVDGAAVEQPAHGALLGLGDRIYVRIDNRSAAPLHAHVFNIGTGGKVTRLTGFATLGVPLLAGHGYTLGAVDGVGVVGLALTWPRGVPRDTPRRDEIVVIATSQPVDLGVLETEHRLLRGAGARAEPGLRGLLEQLRRGGTRSVEPAPPVDGFVAARRSFELAPVAGRIAVAADAFLVDDNPTGMHAALAPRAWLPARRPGPVARSAAAPLAIRLTDLVVDGLGGVSGGLRIDSLVCTRAAGAPPCAVRTIRVPRPRAGAPLDLGDGVLHRGAIGDFVDVAVWLSADGGPPLDELLAAAGSAELEEAMTTLRHVAAVAMPWVAAVGASAVLIRAAHDVLRRASATTVGLYRSSFLAAERFGEGRRRASGPRGAPGVSFAIEVARERAAARRRAPA